MKVNEDLRRKKIQIPEQTRSMQYRLYFFPGLDIQTIEDTDLTREKLAKHYMDTLSLDKAYFDTTHEWSSEKTRNTVMLKGSEIFREVTISKNITISYHVNVTSL